MRTSGKTRTSQLSSSGTPSALSRAMKRPSSSTKVLVAKEGTVASWASSRRTCFVYVWHMAHRNGRYLTRDVLDSWDSKSQLVPLRLTFLLSSSLPCLPDFLCEYCRVFLIHSFRFVVIYIHRTSGCVLDPVVQEMHQHRWSCQLDPSIPQRSAWIRSSRRRIFHRCWSWGCISFS